MRTVLKGSPSWSIANDGTVSISTTWMCLRDPDADGQSPASVSMGWLNFQNEVEQFAGSAGDKYKMPMQGDSDKEVDKYTESNAFIVTSVSYQAVEARTHYEVTFEHTQNFAIMSRIGDVEMEVNENNEITKTAKFKVSVPEGDLDSLIIKSGSEAVWAGELYYITQSSYTAEVKGVYTVDITAVDMSYMRIGMPTESVDSRGVSTMKCVWRYSVERYNSSELPVVGADASPYVGKDGFVISEVSATNQGVYGYQVEITAVSHIEGTRLTARKSIRRDTQDNVMYTEWETNLQADSTTLEGLNHAVINEELLLPEGVTFPQGHIDEISYDEYVKGKYNVAVRMSDNRLQVEQDPTAQWDVEVSTAQLRLTMEQCGWGKGPSGEPYRLNFPPTTRFRYTMSPTSLIEMRTASGNTVPTVAESQLLNTIKNFSTIGLDRIVGVQGMYNGVLKWLTKPEAETIRNIKDINNVMLEGFVYAQPTMTQQGATLRNQLFTPWRAAESCPITLKGTWTTVDGRDVPLHRHWLNHAFTYHELRVSMTYDIDVKSALKQPSRNYYQDAISKIECANYVSYKAAGIQFAAQRTTDNYGDVVDLTKVTCTIHALLATNAGPVYWNRAYDSAVVKGA